MPEYIDPVFSKTSPKRSFSMTENELVLVKTGSINSDTGHDLMPVFRIRKIWNADLSIRLISTAS